MGFFGKFIHSDGDWREAPTGDAFLAIDIHDSDIAIVDFQSARSDGRFYLGFQPRDSWGNPDASDPVDIEAAAAGLSAWTTDVLGRSVPPSQIEPLLAADGVEEPEDDFVEETVMRLIQLLDLPAPADLPTPP
jgi:hypothetical protein